MSASDYLFKGSFDEAAHVMPDVRDLLAAYPEAVLTIKKVPGEFPFLLMAHAGAKEGGTK